MQRRSLCPSLTGLVVADVLKEHFPDFTDTQFTAQVWMEGPCSWVCVAAGRLVQCRDNFSETML